MSEASKILSKELSSCSNFTTTESGTMVSKLAYEYKTFSPTRFKCYYMVPKGDGLWGIPSEVHFISGTRVIWTTPLIKVKKEYRDTVSVRYTENPGHQVVTSATIDFDSKGSFTETPIESDIKRAFMVKDKQKYDHDIGNHGKFSKWSDTLVRYPLTIKQGWFFSNACALSIPCMGDGTNITFKIITETDISKLIMMRKKVDGEYKYTKCDMKYLEVSAIEKPAVLCTGSSVTDAELEFYKSNGKTLYLHDMKVISDTTPRSPGDKFFVQINSTAPVKAIFWVARNEAAYTLGNKSNYTTNVTDSGKGWNPCEFSGTVPSIYINPNGLYVESSPHYFHDRGLVVEGFPSTPDKMGFNVCPLSRDCLSVDMEDAMILDDIPSCGVAITIGDTNPSKSGRSLFPDIEFVEGRGISKKDFRKEKRYEVFVVLLTSKKMTITWDPVRNKMNYTISG